MTLSAQSIKEIEIKGKLLDKETNQPIEYATVLVADNTTLKPIKGTTTDINGNFSLVTTATNFYIEVSFIGYKKAFLTNLPKRMLL
uniref:carboxypeptidase-like regulatory domain-containing protein n=1 Tax=Mariniflexile sp. TaxID=1979402 RepID=UPI00404840E5